MILFLINEWVADTKLQKEKGVWKFKRKNFQVSLINHVASQDVDPEEDEFDIINESRDLTLEEISFYLYNIEDKLEWLEGSRESTLKDRSYKNFKSYLFLPIYRY